MKQQSAKVIPKIIYIWKCSENHSFLYFLHFYQYVTILAAYITIGRIDNYVTCDPRNVPLKSHKWHNEYFGHISKKNYWMKVCQSLGKYPSNHELMKDGLVLVNIFFYVFQKNELMYAKQAGAKRFQSGQTCWLDRWG